MARGGGAVVSTAPLANDRRLGSASDAAFDELVAGRAPTASTSQPPPPRPPKSQAVLEAQQGISSTSSMLKSSVVSTPATAVTVPSPVIRPDTRLPVLVDAFLATLGLVHHGAAFRARGYDDLRVVVELTAADFVALGLSKEEAAQAVAAGAQWSSRAVHVLGEDWRSHVHRALESEGFIDIDAVLADQAKKFVDVPAASLF